MSDKMRRRVTCGISLGLFLTLFFVLTILFWDSLTSYAKDPSVLGETMAEQGWRGMAVFVALTAAQVVLAIIPGHPFEVAGGYCFGVGMGVLLVSLGTLLGSTVAFFLSRVFGARAVSAFYAPEKLEKVKILQAGEKQTVLTFFAFLLPGVPKDMITYFMGLTKMRFPVFLLVSTLGRLPGIFIAVLGGAVLETHSKTFFALFIALLAVTILASLLYHLLSKRKQHENKG